MGKPAARLGDMTAHGGTITGPGCPTVLIGGMPAATMGDMHVCPMVTPGTPPIPHVGGPITLGSAGVLIGGKPAARMGDMAVCVGPPSSIILGCMTVLIGEVGGGGGGGGGGGAGAGGGSAAAGAITSAAIAGVTPQATTVEGHFLDATFIDNAKSPIGGIGYLLEYPDQTKQGGVLGGQIRCAGVPQGNSNVTLRGIVNAQWSVQQANVGSAVDLIVETVGVDNGAKATLAIVVRDGNYADHVLTALEATVNNDQIRIPWTLRVDEKFLSIGDAKEKHRRYSLPFFYFVVGVEGLSERSGVMYWRDQVEIELRDGDGNQLKQEPYVIKLTTGEVHQGSTDGQGRTGQIPTSPGKGKVEFPNIQSRIDASNRISCRSTPAIIRGTDNVLFCLESISGDPLPEIKAVMINGQRTDRLWSSEAGKIYIELPEQLSASIQRISVCDSALIFELETEARLAVDTMEAIRSLGEQMQVLAEAGQAILDICKNSGESRRKTKMRYNAVIGQGNRKFEKAIGSLSVNDSEMNEIDRIISQHGSDIDQHK
jgi:uncharacterized Zn-binding protein involved in type VI secretion